MRILLLVGSTGDLDLSHAIYANGLRRLGYDVDVGDLNSISSRERSLSCLVAPVTEELVPFSALPGRLSRHNIEGTDVVWMLNQPHPALAQDIWQLVWRLNQDVPFVNDVVGLLMLNNKNNLSLLVPPEHLPFSLSSSDARLLREMYQTAPDQPWVIKPTNAGAGADVFILEPSSTNNTALIDSLTGNAATSGAVTRGSLLGLQSRFALLQGFVPHRREKRVVITGGEPTIQWSRILAHGEHRGNVSHGAGIEAVDLTEAERELARAVGATLLAHGIRFAGIDVAYPAVFELNLVNPGGLVEPAQLGIPDPYLLPALSHILSAVPGLPALP